MTAINFHTAGEQLMSKQSDLSSLLDPSFAGIVQFRTEFRFMHLPVQSFEALDASDEFRLADSHRLVLLLAASSFGLVLGFARRNRLPLHVGGRVRSAALQRLDMIDHIAGAPPARPARGRARMLPLEGMLGDGFPNPLFLMPESCSPDHAHPSRQRLSRWVYSPTPVAIDADQLFPEFLSQTQLSFYGP